MNPERLFLENLRDIEGLTRSLCRRHGFRGAEAEDVESWIKARLVEDDYAILRKFEARSKLTTYLTVVLTNLVHDYRVQREGRWRPSVAAKRMGALGVQLDTLVYRDGLSHHEAVATVRAEFPDAPRPSDLFRMIAELPERAPHRLVGDEVLADVATSSRADEGLLEHERDRHAAGILEALEGTLAALDDEDQVILRLRFEQGMTTAAVGRFLGLEQKPLYRRVEGLLARVGKALRERGFGKTDVAELLARHAETGEPAPGIAWGTPPPDPTAAPPSARERKEA